MTSAYAPACETGRRYVQVPWERAEHLHRRLRERGCPSTLCVDLLKREARLEPWPGVSPDAISSALAELSMAA